MNAKRITITIIMLLTMFLSCMAEYLGSGIEYYIDRAFWYGLLSFSISTLIMIIIPLITRFKKLDKLETKEGKKLCLWNSIIAFISSTLLNVAGTGGIIGGVGAFCFYFINKWLFVKDEVKPEKKNEEETENNDEMS